MTVTVVGGGLAGCEAAWALAERGIRVTIMRDAPGRKTPAHQTDRLAELVCSNSFKSTELTNAHGLLKAELRLLGSLLLRCADEAQRAGGLRARGRSRPLLRPVHEQVIAHPNIRVERAEVTTLPSPGIVATGPLTSESPRRGHRGPAGRVGARVLRCHRPDRERRVARSRPAVRAAPATGREAATTISTRRSTREDTRRSSRRWSRPTSSPPTTSTRCPTSRAACRSRRWRGGAARRCASVR